MTNTRRLKSALFAVPAAALTALAGFCISPALSASSAGATPTTYVAQTPDKLAADQYSLSGTCILTTYLMNDAYAAVATKIANDAMLALVPGTAALPPAGVWVNGVWQPAWYLEDNYTNFLLSGAACTPDSLLLPAPSDTTTTDAPSTTQAPPTTDETTTTDAPPTTNAPTTTVPPTTVATSYTVTFLPNGGVGAQAVYTETDNAPTALTANPFTRSGYTFDGWNTATDGSGTAYADGDTYPFTADMTLYAQWAPIIVAPGAFTLTETKPCIVNRVLVFNLNWTVPSGTAPFTYTLYYKETVSGSYTPVSGNVVVAGNTETIQITGAHLLLSGKFYVTATNSAGTSTSNTVDFN